MKITFLGAVQEVTGSRYLIEHHDTKILVDCGLFQGDKMITQRNWDPFPVDPASIDAIVLTHGHIDHTGYIPLFVKNGFKGKIYCSNATYELCAILLIDCGNIQEDQARHSKKRLDSQKKVSRQSDVVHQKAQKNAVLPLYTKADAQNSLKFFQPVEYEAVVTIKSLQVTLIRSGHILGSAFIVVTDGKQKLTFSGDLGRPEQFIQKAPPHLKDTDFLVLESTYGNRLHQQGDPIQALGDVVHEAIQKKGVLIIPSFVVERTQTILYCLYQLKQTKMIPDIPIFLDSPTGVSVTNLFCKYKEDLNLPPESCKKIFNVATYINSVEESKQLDNLTHSAIIIAGSGMADGGRVMYHLQRYISDAKHTVAFVGYQARGTKGRLLVDGIQEIKIYGKIFPVKAEIKTLGELSAHADYNEILEWLSFFEKPPKKVFLTHGEIEAAESLKDKIEQRFGWSVVAPKYLESYDLE